MEYIREISKDVYWVGANDRRLALFENIFPIPRGVSYNSYLITDEKTVLLDTVDFSVSRQFMENLAAVLGERPLDYLVVNHMEPDHGSTIEELVRIYPGLKIICNAKAAQMMKQFFTFDIDSRVEIVKEGDTFSCGTHQLTFVMAPMVHWPEVMMTYEIQSKILFCADAFGTFGALEGGLFNDEFDFERDWLDDARRYYANIVGKYGAQVQAALKKTAGLDISMLCSLHGPVWRTNLDYILGKYDLWSRYEPEENGVVIVYASMYGNTESAVNALAGKIAEKGVQPIAVHNVSGVNVSYIISDMFKYSHIVIASPTYNGRIYPLVEAVMTDAKALNVQNRSVCVIENGSWAPGAGKQIREILESMKNMTILADTLTIKSTLKKEDAGILDILAGRIADSMEQAQ